jgi:hypothetical protein
MTLSSENALYLAGHLAIETDDSESFPLFTHGKPTLEYDPKLQLISKRSLAL